jgi:hypothetical protein
MRPTDISVRCGVTLSNRRSARLGPTQHHGDAKQVYVAARHGEVFGTHGGESRVEMPLPQGVQHIYALACG